MVNGMKWLLFDLTQNITRLCLENVALLLDIEAKGFPDVVERVVHRMAEQHSLHEKVAAQIRLVLGYRHKHVTKNGLMSKNESLAFLSNNKLAHMSGKDAKVTMEMQEVGTPTSARQAGILSCLDPGTEGSISLVGALPDISKPAVALVRLAKAVMMPKTTEISLPVRFIFIAFTPSSDMDFDHHEIGRSMSTLMADKVKTLNVYLVFNVFVPQNFHNIAYHAREKADLLKGVNEFLDEVSLVSGPSHQQFHVPCPCPFPCPFIHVPSAVDLIPSCSKSSLYYCLLGTGTVVRCFQWDTS